MRTQRFVVMAAMIAALAYAHASAQIQNPIKGVKEAIKKVREESARKPPQTAPATAAPPKGSTPPAAAAPWTPPADNPNAPAIVLDPLKLPDVIGVHLGMTPAQAVAALRKQYPKDIYEDFVVDWWPNTVKPNTGYTVLSSQPGNEADAHLSLTAPPGPQVVWKVVRFSYRMHINHATLLMALRQKYGKEAVAYQESDQHPVTDDRRMSDLYWLFDERGARVPMPSAASLGFSTIAQCVFGTSQPVMPTDDETFTRPWADVEVCKSFVTVHVSISSQEIVEDTVTQVMDVPLAIRTARASAAWLRDVAEKKRQEELEKSKAAKPVL